jgi:inhibitor of KinA sporulation pathway (predicted exonuclease)
MTAANLGKIVVIDLEATCWDTEIPPTGEKSEIIEVGIVLLSTTTLEISKPRRLFINPLNSTVSDFCTKLTGITTELLLEKGKTHGQVIDILLSEYKLDKRIWAGWGIDNVELIQSFRQSVTSQDQIDRLSKSYINVAALFSSVVNLGRRIGLTDALTIIGEPFKGIHHNGGDDAYNAAVVLRHLLSRLRASITEIPNT